MSETIHELSVAERGDWLVARIGGDVDQSNVAEIEAAIRGSASTQPLIVDLSDAQYLDSAGVAMLESLRQRGDLALVLPSRSLLRRVLHITALDQLVPTFESVDECPLHLD